MTNFEKYKDAVLSMIDDNCGRYGVVDGEPLPCEGVGVDCFKCQLYRDKTNVSCTAGFIKWLYQEYQEKPKITERFYHFLKSLPKSARIKYSRGFLHINIVDRTNSIYCADCLFLPKLPSMVEGVWYEVSEMLKWEVEGY